VGAAAASCYTLRTQQYCTYTTVHALLSHHHHIDMMVVSVIRSVMQQQPSKTLEHMDTPTVMRRKGQ